MPILRGRQRHIKVWRPGGSRLAHAHSQRPINDHYLLPAIKATSGDVLQKFVEEFKRKPDFDNKIVTLEISIERHQITAILIEADTE